MPEEQYIPIIQSRVFVRATIVVAPIVLLRQWEREIHKFAPGLDVVIFYNRDRNKFTPRELVGRYDVVLTNYHTVVGQYKLFRSEHIRKRILLVLQSIPFCCGASY